MKNQYAAELNRRNLRKLTIKVTPQTAYNLHRLADMGNIPVGRVVDKLVREKMISLHQPPGPWGAHYLTRFKRVT